MMGNLPEHRVKVSAPFSTCGVDYAGPLLIKDRKGRGSKTSKCYVCLFICFSVKAVHLELVTDLSTDSFLLALRRFVSRRGLPLHIYSDNGTNFVGANASLRELGSFLRTNSNDILAATAAKGITWHFIPGHSPHFGGLWEAGVKSAKHHLRRVVGNALLTFEELYSTLVQIEAVLNSRPLTPLSTDPNDLTPLTPSHFLVGRPLTSVPDEDVTHVPESRLSRFQRVQLLQQHFWARWSKEFISQLQQRLKWRKSEGSLREGDMVLIKDDHLPPMKWRLGRIIELHCGKDTINRVASIKTQNGVIRRSFAKICPLPIDASTVM